MENTNNFLNPYKPGAGHMPPCLAGRRGTEFGHGCAVLDG